MRNDLVRARPNKELIFLWVHRCADFGMGVGCAMSIVTIQRTMRYGGSKRSTDGKVTVWSTLHDQALPYLW